MDFEQVHKEIHHQITSPGVIALYIVILILVESLGNFLLFCMIFYEKYGMDAQKRTVTNQLLSSMIVVLILFNIVVLPITTVVVTSGPISKFT